MPRDSAWKRLQFSLWTSETRTSSEEQWICPHDGVRRELRRGNRCSATPAFPGYRLCYRVVQRLPFRDPPDHLREIPAERDPFSQPYELLATVFRQSSTTDRQTCETLLPAAHRSRQSGAGNSRSPCKAVARTARAKPAGQLYSAGSGESQFHARPRATGSSGRGSLSFLRAKPLKSRQALLNPQSCPPGVLTVSPGRAMPSPAGSDNWRLAAQFPRRRLRGLSQRNRLAAGPARGREHYRDRPTRPDDGYTSAHGDAAR